MKKHLSKTNESEIRELINHKIYKQKCTFTNILTTVIPKQV